MTSPCIPKVRPLYAWEIQQANRLFKNSLLYDQIHIHECARWPNTVKRLDAWIRRLPDDSQDNAITLGNHCYFPGLLPAEILPPEHPDFKKLPWLMHELTHVWQFQHLGWSYLPRVLLVHLRFGAHVYGYGLESGLIQARQQGKHWGDFNLEQQGELARDYYRRLVTGQDFTAWQPFIDELQQVA